MNSLFIDFQNETLIIAIYLQEFILLKTLFINTIKLWFYCVSHISKENTSR